MNRTRLLDRCVSTALCLSAVASIVTAQADPLYSIRWQKPAAGPGAVRTKTPGNPSAEALLKDLLARPAPPPRTGAETTEPRERGEDFFDTAKAPPEDAPIEDLLAYWQRTSNTGGPDGPKITERIKERLLSSCETDPEPLSSLLDCLPDGSQTADRIQRIYDGALTNPDIDDDWRAKIRNWLRLNSTIYLPDLVRLANKATDGEGAIENEEELVALAKRDRDSALPILKTHLTGSQPRTAALALVWLYRYAIEDGASSDEDRYRNQLKQIATDRTALGAARNAAIEGLCLTEWSGRDEWYRALFADESLVEISDASVEFNPLTTLFDSDPPKWIPLMAELLESKVAAVRRNAGNCLAQYVRNHARREAIVPLLRWLSDPTWLDLGFGVRIGLIEKLQTVIIPESIPGLIWIIANDDPAQRIAARTLANYPDARAIPVVKQALAREKSEDARQDLLRGLFAAGGLSDAEGLEGLEAFAAGLNQKDEQGVAVPLPYLRFAHAPDEMPLVVSVGKFFALKDEVPESLADAVFTRAAQLERTDPELAQKLLTIAQHWKGRRVDLDLVQRIGAGTADAVLIAGGLDRREDMAKSVPVPLRALTAARGTAAGIAAAMLGDVSLAQQLLAGQDQLSQIALLAGARLVQLPLPPDQVGALLRSKNALLAQAAEKYLLAEDSREARKVLWERYPQQGYVTGWRESYPQSYIDLSIIEKTETALREELMAGTEAPEQIFAFFEMTPEPRRVIRVYANRITDTLYVDSSRYRDRTLTGDEMGSFRRYLAESQITDAGPQLEDCGYDCRLAEFLALSRGGGRRVMIEAGGETGRSVLSGFGTMTGGGAKTHYYLEKEVPGAEILIEADATFAVKQIAQENGTFLVQLEREPTAEELELTRQERVQVRLAAENQLDNVDELEKEFERRRAERARERVTWHTLTDGRMNATPTTPALAYSGDLNRFEIERDQFPPYLNSHPIYGAAGNVVVVAGGYVKPGLWRKSIGEAPVLLTEERMYSGPVLTSNGKWVVAAKARSNWAEPNDVIRLNLTTGTEYRVELPGAHQFEAVAYLPTTGKVLLRRARDDDDDPKDTEAGPPAPEFYLLNAETGKTQLVKGDFEPLLQTGTRKLQPAGKANELWAALPDDQKNETRLVRYNLNDFSQQTVMTIPHLSFKSEAMWIDEAKGKVYIVYEGQLISVPLKISNAGK